MATTLQELLLATADAGRGGLRFVDRREQAVFVPWHEVAERALAAAAELAARGVAAGDRLAIILRTSPRFFDAFFGALFAGAVPVPLYPPVRLGKLAEYHRRTAAMLHAVGARHLVSEPGLSGLLGESTGSTVAILELGNPPTAGVATPPITTPTELALVQFSSGTTVDPKPVALGHRAVLAQTRLLNDHWRHLEEASGVSWLPLYHDMGLIGCVFPALELAAELTLLPPELFVHRPALWLRTLSRYRGTVSPAPNFAYGLCVDRITDDELEGVDLSPWRVALNGAETVSPEVLRRFVERFAPFGFRREALSPVYGLSEASLAVTFPDLGAPFETLVVDRRRLAEEGVAVDAAEGRELVSVGRPLPEFEIEIRGDDGSKLGDDRVGRLWVRGPSLMDGYLDRPEATAGALVDGWLDTGDRGFRRDGQLYLVGRDKDLLIVRGRNHAPEEVERAVDRVAGVRTGCCAAVGAPQEDSGEEAVRLFVELRRGIAPSPDLERRCRDAVREETGIEIDELHLLSPGTLPRTSSGKIRRGETLHRHLTGHLTPPKRFHLGRLAVAWWRSWRARRAPRRADA